MYGARETSVVPVEYLFCSKILRLALAMSREEGEVMRDDSIGVSFLGMARESDGGICIKEERISIEKQ
jgi:hypothetical protein